MSNHTRQVETTRAQNRAGLVFLFLSIMSERQSLVGLCQDLGRHMHKVKQDSRSSIGSPRGFFGFELEVKPGMLVLDVKHATCTLDVNPSLKFIDESWFLWASLRRCRTDQASYLVYHQLDALCVVPALFCWMQAATLNPQHAIEQMNCASVFIYVDR